MKTSVCLSLNDCVPIWLIIVWIFSKFTLSILFVFSPQLQFADFQADQVSNIYPLELNFVKEINPLIVQL